MNKFTLGKYRTHSLDSFLYNKPIPEEKKFPYDKLMGMIHNLENDNSLAILILNSVYARAKSSNKSQFIKNAKLRKQEISQFLNDIESLYKEL